MVFVGSTVRLWSLLWPMDPQYRCLLWLRGFKVVSVLHSEGAVPPMAQGLKA